MSDPRNKGGKRNQATLMPSTHELIRCVVIHILKKEKKMEQIEKEFLVEFDPHIVDKSDYGLALITWATLGSYIYETINSGAANGVIYFNHDFLTRKLLDELICELIGLFGEEYLNDFNKDAEFTTISKYVSVEVVYYVEAFAFQIINDTDLFVRKKKG